MTETHTFDVRGPDGTDAELRVTELTELEKLRWAMKMPDSLKQISKNPEEADEIQVGPEVVGFLLDLVKEQTVLTEELIEELSQDELSRLFNAVTAYSFGEEFDASREKIEFEGGSIDLEEWR